MVEADIHAIDRISQSSSHPVIAHLFIPCSPIRRYVEKWEVDELERLTRFGVGLATKLELLTGNNVTSVPHEVFDITTAPVGALIKGIDTTFVTMTLITFASIMLAVFLWWQSTNISKTNTEVLIVTSKN